MKPKKQPSTNLSTSWQPVSKWYQNIVGETGHYYHQHVIIPKTLALLELDASSSRLLDLACGQGILSRFIPQDIFYVGVDIAEDFIQWAKKSAQVPHFQFLQADITKKLPVKEKNFTHASLILALQNIEHPLKVFQNAATHLQKEGLFLLVCNHPCFRIPRQSSWKVDEQNKTQYRRIDRYLSPLKVPIVTHPSQTNSTHSWSFHYPLSDYSKWLKEAGFSIELIEEWCSDKESMGKNAKTENRMRQEIPLFMAILARKKS